MTQDIFVMTGDSLGAGTAYGFQAFAALGNVGNWWEITLRRISAALGLPIVSMGRRGVWTYIIGSDTEWSFTTTSPNNFTLTVATDAWDVLPSGKGLYGSGINKVATFNRPTINYPRAVGAGIYVVDYTNGGRAQYRVTLNGTPGAWTQYPFTPDHSNRIVKFYVPGDFDIIEFRGYDGTADCGVFPASVEPYFLDPSSDGIIWHNECVGTQTLRSNFASTNGDRLRIVKDVVCLGSNSVSPTPNKALFNININDANLNNDTQWNTDMDSYHTKFGATCPIHWISPWECNGDSSPNARQAAWRAVTESNAATNGDAFFDLNDKCIDLGWLYGGMNSAAGFTEDTTHLSAYGHKLVARWMFEYILKNFYSTRTPHPYYKVVGKRSSTDISKARRVSTEVAKMGLPLTLADA